MEMIKLFEKGWRKGGCEWFNGKIKKFGGELRGVKEKGLFL